MHGNTECVAGYKTRRFDNIRAEVRPWSSQEPVVALLLDRYKSARLPLQQFLH